MSMSFYSNHSIVDTLEIVLVLVLWVDFCRFVKLFATGRFATKARLNSLGRVDKFRLRPNPQLWRKVFRKSFAPK